MHLRQKGRLRPELCPKFFVNFRPETDPKSPARLTTLLYAVFFNAERQAGKLWIPVLDFWLTDWNQIIL